MTPQLFLFTGDDEAQIKSKAQQTVESLCPDLNDPFRLEIMSQEETESPDSLIERFTLSYMTPAFMGEKTLWLKNFMHFDKENAKSNSPLATNLRNFIDLLKEGLPHGIQVIISGPNCDQRKALFKTCAKLGETQLFKKPEKRQRQWQQDMSRIINETAQKMQLQIQPRALEYLVTAIGNDTERIKPTLETLWAYCNGPGPVNLQQVTTIISGNEAADSWVFSNAIASRDLKSALNAVNILLNREKDPESAVTGILLQASTQFQQFLQAKLLMQRLGAKNPAQVESILKSKSDVEKKQLSSLYTIAGFHPYRLKLLLENSQHYNNRETLEAIELVNQALQKIFKSGSSKRLLLETLTLNIISKQRIID